VHSDPDLYSALDRWGLRLGIVWLAALGAALVWQLTRSGAAVPVLIPACAYVTLVAWQFQHGLDAGFLGNDPFAVRLWRWEAVALAALACGVGWGLLRERRARSAIARLVVELARAPRPGGLRDALAEALGDDSVVLAYRRTATGQHIDGRGDPLDLDPSPQQIVTPLRRGELTVAALVHDRRLLEEPGLLTEVVSGAQLALANEQLQAEERAQLRDLSSSRARIVEAGDGARRQLERDLHDGAQQRIVGLLLAVRVLRAQLGESPDREQLRRLDAVAGKLEQALDELREVAHGLYPAVLFDDGLAAAVEMLAERLAPQVEVEHVVAGRFEAPVESAAYFAVAEAVRDAASASVALSRRERELVVTVERRSEDWPAPERLQEIADRVGALDGRVTVERAVLRAEIPCAS
jgi:signal transduction histidine kinase